MMLVCGWQLKPLWGIVCGCELMFSLSQTGWGTLQCKVGTAGQWQGVKCPNTNPSGNELLLVA